MPSQGSLRSQLDVDHDTDVYFHSPLNGARCVIVIEHSIVIRRVGSSAPSEQAIGWAIIPAFDDRSVGRLKDTSETSSSARGGYDSNRETQRLDMYQGSPLALLQPELSPPYERAPFLKRSSAQLMYTLRTHRALKPATGLYLLPTDVFTTCEVPWPGMLPSRDPSANRLLLAPFSKPDLRTMQTACKLNVSSFRITLPTTLETETARAAYAQMQAPQRGGGKAQPPPAKVVTNQRRLLIALHSSHSICVDKNATGIATPPTSADGRTVGPPPGSLVAPRTVILEEDRTARAPPGSMCLRPAGAVAALDGFIISPSVAFVVEMQVEISAPPPPGRQFERRTKFVTIAWGCAVLCQDGAAPNFPSRLRFELGFGGLGKPSPLSLERLPAEGSVLASAKFGVPSVEAEVNPQPGANLTAMRREVEAKEVDEATNVAAGLLTAAAASLPPELAAAERSFRGSYAAPAEEGESTSQRLRDDGADSRRDTRDDRRDVRDERRDPREDRRDARDDRNDTRDDRRDVRDPRDDRRDEKRDDRCDDNSDPDPDPGPGPNLDPNPNPNQARR